MISYLVQVVLLCEGCRLIAGQKAVEFVLEPKLQSTVLDTDHSVDLDASDAVNLHV